MLKTIGMLALLLWLSSPAAFAESIQAVGAIGNSGAAGDSLITVGDIMKGRCASGAAVDSDLTLWLSGVDSINRIGLDGRLIERHAIEPDGCTVDSPTFAKLDGTLYFFGRTPDKKQGLFALPMKPKSTAKPTPVAPPDGACVLAAEPLDGRLVIAAEPNGPQGIVVFSLDPANGTFTELFTTHGRYVKGAAIDQERKVIYLGLDIDGPKITALKPEGSPAYDGFPIACMKTPAIPTQFRGLASLAGGALWDTAWYGFVARFDLRGNNAPGRVTEWSHDLDYPTQIVGITTGHARYDTLLITTPNPAAFYFAWWDRIARQLILKRRIGCLPVIASLGLSPEGHITVGDARSQLWWQWEDAADAPPARADIHVAVTPGHFDNDRFFAICAQYDLASRGPLRPTVFPAKAGDRNEAQRLNDKLPMKKPVGLALKITPGKNEALALITDADTKQIWCTDTYLGQFRLNDAKWRQLAIKDAALADPTDLAALTDARIILADAGRILMLEPEGDAYKVAWSIDRWGGDPDQHFGKHVRLAVDGSSVIVSDTDRHRVLWFDWTRRKLLAQFGQTDKPGADAAHLSAPTLVSVSGARAVVADSGNQRVLKLRLIP